MKYSLNWLKEYLKTNKTAEEIGQDLVLLGSEVEELSSFPNFDERIIAAKITKIEPHPNADRLRLPTVFDGENEIRLVCGAPNIEVGQIVPLAKVGAKIGDFEINEAEIRGVKSCGMLCSERELGISDEHTGIMILPENTEPGCKVRDILSADYVFDLEITPNRGDLLSHFGLARDLSAKYGIKLEKTELKIDESGESNLEVEVKSDKCPLYLAREVRGVKIAESPDWLKEKLLSVGAKSINNVVDITNYIMLDLGQPLHAFDKSKLTCNKIVVKEIEEEMDVATLDGEARAVLPEMLGIWDGEKPVAVAGVMGLGNSEVDESTTEIVLEAAVFDRKSIRKTAKLLGLKTDASARFERGIDAASTQYALDKAAKMIAEIAGGSVSALVKAKTEERIEKKELKIKYEKINNYAELNLSNTEIDKILSDLGFEVNDGVATVPTWRHDISIWQDLAEEVYRINGLEKIKPIELESGESSAGAYHKKEAIKDVLATLGLDESISYTFLSDEDITAAKLDTGDLLEVANPVQEENRYLRNSLIPGLLKAVAKNPSFDDVELFEIGTVFSKDSEWFSLAIATSGKSSRSASEIVDELTAKFGFDKNVFNIYEIPSDELTRFKIKKPSVSVAEIKIDDLLDGKFEDLELKISQTKKTYRPISKYPSAKRDLAFIVEKEISSDEIESVILEVAPQAILAELFDEFESEKLGQGKKSVAFHIWLEDEKKTLSDQEADEIISKIVDGLKEKFGASLRK